MELKLPRNRVLRGGYLMVQRYLRHNVGIQSAALAFYLLFMIFPFLIFISALLGLLRLDVAGILLALGEILPRGVVDLIEVYLTYVSRNPSPHLLVFGLVFSIYFPMRATNSLMRSVRTAYHLGPPRGPARHVLKTLLYTVMLIVTIAAALALMTVGDRVLSYAVLRGGGLGAAAVPGGGGAVLLRAVLPLRHGPGRPPALAEHLARHPGGSDGLDGRQLAVCVLRG